MFKKMKKGQAAMEFLMTYGWAILVVLVAIGALAYFGVLDPSRLVPERCAVGPPISCSESGVDENGVSMILSNTDSRIMEITKIDILSDAIGSCSWNSTGNSHTNGPNPTLESGNPAVVYTLSSSNSVIPVSAKASLRDVNFNINATSNDSLVGCNFRPATSRAKNQYEFTITYNWKDSSLSHAVTGQFVNTRPS